MPKLPNVEVMSRASCHLCDEAKLIVAEAASAGLCDWQMVNVDGDARLLKRYGLDVPVILVDGEVCFKHRVDLPALRQALKNGGTTTC